MFLTENTYKNKNDEKNTPVQFQDLTFNIKQMFNTI